MRICETLLGTGPVQRMVEGRAGGTFNFCQIPKTGIPLLVAVLNPFSLVELNFTSLREIFRRTPPKPRRVYPHSLPRPVRKIAPPDSFRKEYPDRRHPPAMGPRFGPAYTRRFEPSAPGHLFPTFRSRHQALSSLPPAEPAHAATAAREPGFRRKRRASVNENNPDELGVYLWSCLRVEDGPLSACREPEFDTGTVTSLLMSFFEKSRIQKQLGFRPFLKSFAPRATKTTAASQLFLDTIVDRTTEELKERLLERAASAQGIHLQEQPDRKKKNPALPAK